MRAISLYCDLVVDSVLDGIQQEMVAAGVDIGAVEEPVGTVPEHVQEDGGASEEAMEEDDLQTAEGSVTETAI